VITSARQYGGITAMAFVVGTVIGTGIYLQPSRVAQMAPEPWQNLLLWAAGGLFALFGAFVYARLSEVWPDSGGAFVYLRNCYGEWVGSLLLAADVLLARPAAVGALAAGLWQKIWELDGEGTLALAVGTLLALAAGQMLGRQATGGIQVALTALKMLPLLFVAGAGVAMPKLANPPQATGDPVLWASGFLAVMWAYDGWYNITILGGEVKRPEVHLRRSLLGGVLFVTVVYVGLNALLLAKVPRAEIMAQGVPFAALLQGWDTPTLDLALRWALSIALLATLNGTLACGPSMLAAGGLGGSDLVSVRRSTLLFSGWCLGLMLLFAGLPSQFGLFERLSEYTVVVVAALSGLTVSCVFHLPRLGYSVDLPTRLCALAFLLIDLGLMLLLAWEQGALALGGTLSVLIAGTLLYALRRARGQL
jgi:APA family basic amino acid/polyamine antiporter